VQYKYLALVVCLALAGPAMASDAPASDASIRELLTLTDAHKLIDTIRGQVDGMVNASSQQALYLRTYRASFTQHEIDGIIKFYKTPAGQAMIKKMPVVMKNVMGEMQGLLQPMQQRMQEIQRETLQELKDLPATDGQEK
jgi:hypothetical protein